MKVSEGAGPLALLYGALVSFVTLVGATVLRRWETVRKARDDKDREERAKDPAVVTAHNAGMEFLINELKERLQTLHDRVGVLETTLQTKQAEFDATLRERDIHHAAALHERDAEIDQLKARVKLLENELDKRMRQDARDMQDNTAAMRAETAARVATQVVDVANTLAVDANTVATDRNSEAREGSQ